MGVGGAVITAGLAVVCRTSTCRCTTCSRRYTSTSASSSSPCWLRWPCTWHNCSVWCGMSSLMLLDVVGRVRMWMFRLGRRCSIISSIWLLLLLLPPSNCSGSYGSGHYRSSWSSCRRCCHRLQLRRVGVKQRQWGWRWIGIGTPVTGRSPPMPMLLLLLLLIIGG